MKTSIFAALLILCAATLAAQAPATPDNTSVPPPQDTTVVPPPPIPAPPPPPTAPPTAAQAHTSDLGFSYSIPPDWEIMNTPTALPSVLQQAAKQYGGEAEKLIACVQLPLTARHGNPISVIGAVGLPFDCMGHSYSAADLPNVASNLTQSLTKNVLIANPVTNTYTLGTHSMWIQRASGSPAGHTDIKVTLETVCSVLQKGVVCLVAIASDNDALQTFEQGTVVLDTDAATALVPPDALQPKQ